MKVMTAEEFWQNYNKQTTKYLSWEGFQKRFANATSKDAKIAEITSIKSRTLYMDKIVLSFYATFLFINNNISEWQNFKLTKLVYTNQVCNRTKSDYVGFWDNGRIMTNSFAFASKNFRTDSIMPNWYSNGEKYENNCSGVFSKKIGWEEVTDILYFDFIDYDFNLKPLPTYQSLSYFTYQPNAVGTYLTFTDNPTQMIGTFTLEKTGKENPINNVGDIKYENPLVNSNIKFTFKESIKISLSGASYF